MYILVTEYNKCDPTAGSVLPLYFITIDNLKSVILEIQLNLRMFCLRRNIAQLKRTLWLYVCKPNEPIQTLSDLMIDITNETILETYTNTEITTDEIVNILTKI